MKKQITSTILLLALAFMTGCSSDDSSSPGGPGGSEGPDEPGVVETVYYAHKALIEDFTSIGCPACPIGSFIIEELDKSSYSNKIISVAIHDDYNGNNDPYKLPLTATYARHMKVAFYPSLFWNRISPAWDQPGQFIDGEYDENRNPIYFLAKEEFTSYINNTAYLKDKSNIGIKINSTLTEETGQVKLSLKFSENINEELKYVIYVVEDNLVYRQANSTPLYNNTTGNGRWETNFVHNHVVRASNNILGDSIASTETVTDKEFIVTVDLTYQKVNLAETKIAIAILDKDGKVLNAQIAKANTTQDYEIVK